MAAPTVPMSVNARQEFLDLLFLYKQKLVPYLPPLEVSHTSISKTVTKHPSLPRVEVIHTYTVKKIAQAGPRPIANTMEGAIENFSVYSLAELWSAVTKHFAAKQIANPSFASKVRLLGQRVKLTLTRENSAVTEVPAGWRAPIRATTEEIAKWITIDKVVLDSLTRKEQKEWNVLCAIIVATRGGTALPVIPDTLPENEVVEEAGPESHRSDSDADNESSFSSFSSTSIVSYYSTGEEESDDETLHNLVGVASLTRTDVRGRSSARQPEVVTFPPHSPARPELEGLQERHIRFQEPTRQSLEPKSNVASPVPVWPNQDFSISKPEKLSKARELSAIAPWPRTQTSAAEDLVVRARVRAPGTTELAEPPSTSSSSTHGHPPFRFGAETTANDIIREVQIRRLSISKKKVTRVYTSGNPVTPRRARGLEEYRRTAARSNSYITEL